VKLDALSAATLLLPHRQLDYVLSFGLLYLIDSHSSGPLPGSLTQWLPSWGLQIACVLLLQSCIAYWIHRLEHTIPALWSLHQFHHSAERMSILTSDRNTVLGRAVEAALRFIPLALIGAVIAPQPAAKGWTFALVAIYFAYSTFLRVNGYLCHSNLNADYGWLGRWLLVSPRMHRLHHVTAPEYYNKNFTFDLVIWDRLFGTYAHCDAVTAANLPLGLDTSPFNGSNTLRGVLYDYFVNSYLVFWNTVRQGFKAWRPASFSRAPTA
jgi:sterol desaturase/sphingolipid hydroxylase (fatty acid hydroxylase superfamily)